ncbi:endonuclease domain-containing 1 protein-like [Pimephales promelas]|uniref:endonuclease domain-containing 1 protein-like n=1 Tax=Pimephales promelas TaxID=90988 RepID=UPI0019557612|nr:endonuclease domain-containing 1 protein-like [Pimephales promelas]
MRLFIASMLPVFGFPFIVSEVVDSFNSCKQFFFTEHPPMITGILENSVSKDNNRYKLICQKYKNAYKFATLYDTKNRIPVFSAYGYIGHCKGRPQIPWMIEPQLEALNPEMREPCVNQAYSGDYWAQKNFTRGHLFPNGHSDDKITAKSTFTLTNTVPQYKSFNNGSWNSMEQKVRSFMDSHCRDEDNPNNTLAYVLTGSVPSKNTLLNKRVNIPSHVWTVFCCYNSSDSRWVSEAHWAENIDESKDPDKTISAKTLVELQQFLSKAYNRKFKLFSNDCSELKQKKVIYIY